MWVCIWVEDLHLDLGLDLDRGLDLYLDLDPHLGVDLGSRSGSGSGFGSGSRSGSGLWYVMTICFGRCAGDETLITVMSNNLTRIATGKASLSPNKPRCGHP